MGGFVGPAIVGTIAARSFMAALAFGAVMGLAATIGATRMAKLPPFEPKAASPPGAWRHNWLSRAGWANSTSGAWYGLLASYVPVVLHDQHATSTIGLLVALANGCALLGAAACARMSESRMEFVLSFHMVTTGAAAMLFASAAPYLASAAFCVAVGGASAGALQTLGPASMVLSRPVPELGDAMVAAGTFRAGALFLSPATVAGVAAAASVGLGISLVGLLMLLPAMLRASPRPRG